MKRIKEISIFTIITFFLSLFLSIIEVHAAASATVGFSGNSTVAVGSNITVKMYVSNVKDTKGGVVSVGGNLSFDSSYLEYVSGTGVSSPYTFQINTSADYIIAGLDTSLENGITATSQTTVFTFVFKAKKPGTTVVTLKNAKVSDTSQKITANINSKTITITGESGESDDTPSPDTPATDTTNKSSDATLKSLNVSGYTLSPTFKSGTTTYSMKVKNNITSLNVTAIPTNSKAKVTISGNKNWKVGTNVITIKVTAEDGTAKTYKVNVERAGSTTTQEEPDDVKSSDSTLKSLTINSPHEITPEFDSKTTTYDITVPNDVESLDLNAIANNDKAKVKITGNENLKVGQANKIQIEVTAEDGTKTVYTLNVTRSTQTSATDLKELIVTNGELSPKFDPNTTNYTVAVDGNVDKLDITAIAQDSDATVEIIGNENLKEGKNTILIKVTDKEGFTKYYTIEVEKEAKNNKILGLTPLQFGIFAGILSLLLLLFLLLLFLLRRKKKEEEEEQYVEKSEKKYNVPIIEVKPEFNFGSKNTSDDDVVHGNLNQDSAFTEKPYEIPTEKMIEVEEANYEEKLPDDPYDATVTKKEIIDAIYEATRTKDAAKLKILLEQDALNQKKKELKKKENERKKRENDRKRNKEKLDDDDDWRKDI